MPAWPALLLVAVLLGYWLWNPRPAPLPVVPEGPAAPRYLADDAVWQRHAADGTVLLRAEAEALRRYGNGLVEIDHPSLAQLGGEDRWQLQAPSGRILDGGDRLELDAPVTGQVQPEGQAPFALAAGEVWLHPRDRQLGSESPLRLDGEDGRLQADRFTAGWDAHQITLSGHVEARYAATRP